MKKNTALIVCDFKSAKIILCVVRNLFDSTNTVTIQSLGSTVTLQ